MTDDCMGCREPGYSHAAYCPESRVEDLRKRLADSERLREDERLTWDAQHKRQASMNAHLATLVTDAQEELRKCQQDAIQLQARLAEEIENAATYKQERDEIVVNYETVAAQLTEAHRQNADLMAIIDKRDEALGFIPLDKGMDMMDELREAKAQLAEAEALLREALPEVPNGFLSVPPTVSGPAGIAARILAFLAADSASGEGEK